MTSQDELFFFDRVRRALDNRETYNEFLKLINLFTQDIIDMRRLVEKSFSFLGHGELMAQFKEILGWGAAWDVSQYALANDANSLAGHSESMQRPTKADLSLRYGPSYRKLPAGVCSHSTSLMILADFCFRRLTFRVRVAMRCARAS